jgi:hypothetical protein
MDLKLACRLPRCGARFLAQRIRWKYSRTTWGDFLVLTKPRSGGRRTRHVKSENWIQATAEVMHNYLVD